MRNLDELKNSTRLLKDIYNGNIILSKKIAILEQIYANLRILKKEMSVEDYQTEFAKLEASVNSTVTNLTSNSFIDELITRLNNLTFFSAK